MSSHRSWLGRDALFAAAVSAALIAYNNLAGRQRWHETWYPAANLAATGTALAAAAASGLTATDMGLRRDRLASGVRSGGPPALALTAGWLILAYLAVVRIPAGTVLWEEAAFRGVLQASLNRVLPRPAALIVTSAVFGLWHIRPTVDALRINQVAGSRRAALGSVAGAVAATAAAGLLLSGLRERSGSLAAPVLLHLSANSGAVLAGWAARNTRAAGISGPLK
jgi:uncharacterized protein